MSRERKTHRKRERESYAYTLCAYARHKNALDLYPRGRAGWSSSEAHPTDRSDSLLVAGRYHFAGAQVRSCLSRIFRVPFFLGI